MATHLTSWKEIAQYLGKGVRTVQRWERNMGLPVRRPNGRSKGVVFATAEDIDGWLRQQNTQQSDHLTQELEKLRTALAELLAENQVLRAQLERSMRTGPKKRRAEPELTLDVMERSARLIRDAATAAEMYAETIEMSKNLRMLRNSLKAAGTKDRA